MNMFNKNFGCVSCDDGCGKTCGDACGPAAYKCDFDITACPFDPTSWNVTWCGKLHRIKLPPMAETDTSLSTNYSNATLNYTSEAHVDIITGAQLGGLIRMEDLRDTRCNYDTGVMCYELIYKKYGECGDGCKSLENAWVTFSIDSENALGSQIRYVRGANRFGCPYFLDQPDNPNQYWFEGWRNDGQENGYYQAKKVGWVPKDSNGNYVVLSQDYDTKRPLVGVIPWECMLENIFANLGVSVKGNWRPVQGTAGFGAWFNQIDGNFKVYWDDWNDLAETQHAGHGEVTGKLNWNIRFNSENGAMIYTISNIYFDTMTWTVDQGVTASSSPTLHLSGITTPGGTKVDLLPGGVTFGKSSVTRTINRTIECNRQVIVAPGQATFNLDFLYIWVDWVNDDEGYLGAEFSSNLSGWRYCEPGTGY